MSDDFNLPEELLLEILLRLPAEDVVKSTAVCKSWNSFIKNPSFISTHLQKTISSSTNSRLLLFRLPSSKDHNNYDGVVEKYSLRLDNEDADEYKKLHFPSNKFRSFGRCFRVVGICNGLVCLVDDVLGVNNYGFRDYNFVLWNPLIEKTVFLPKPNVRSRRYLALTGFGFDSRTNDFKLLRFVSDHDKSVGVEVYSLNSNRWISITSIANKYSPLSRAQYYYGNSFVNGAIHLLAFDKNGGNDRARNLNLYRKYGGNDRARNLILAFDMSEEVCNEIPLPDYLSNVSNLVAELLTYRQSSIAVMEWKYRLWRPRIIGKHVDLWVLKEYGVATSWTKVFTEEGEHVERVFFFRQAEEQVFVTKRGWIASLDIKTKHRNVLEFELFELLERLIVVDSFVETLALLDK